LAKESKANVARLESKIKEIDAADKVRAELTSQADIKARKASDELKRVRAEAEASQAQVEAWHYKLAPALGAGVAIISASAAWIANNYVENE